MKNRRKQLNSMLRRALRRLNFRSTAIIRTKTQSEDAYLKDLLDLTKVNYAPYYDSHKVELSLTKKGLEEL